MEELKGTVEVAKGISDYGMMAVTAGFFLVVSAVMMVFFMKWFVKLVNGVLEQQNTTLKELLEENRMQTKRLGYIKTGLMDKVMGQVETISNLAFDLSIEQVCKVVKRIRQENNIADTEATKEKILHLLKNLHDERNGKLDDFSYSGKPLSFYTEDKWIDDVAKVVEKEVYAEKENNGRTYSNLKLAYDSIKIAFYRNLRRA